LFLESTDLLPQLEDLSSIFTCLVFLKYEAEERKANSADGEFVVGLQDAPPSSSRVAEIRTERTPVGDGDCRAEV